MDQVQALAMLRSMMLIRAFEAALARRRDHGFQLFSSGEEAVAVGLCEALLPHDQLLVSGRSIAAALARGIEPGAVMAELLGKSAGPNKGKGGRGHIAKPSIGFFGAHAVVGGNLTIAAGAALAAQSKGEGAIVACVFGDGACGSGALHETMNIAAIWKLPLLLVCDNNQYSVSTPRAEALAPERLSDLAKPFAAIPSLTVDGMDVVAVRGAARAFADGVRAGRGPAFLECLSERFYSHSTAAKDTRSAEVLAAARTRCPIESLSARLRADGLASEGGLAELASEVDGAVAEAIAFADAAPYPDASEVLADVG